MMCALRAGIRSFREAGTQVTAPHGAVGGGACIFALERSARNRHEQAWAIAVWLMSSSRSFLFYCGVFLVTAGSVAFSLDWTSAPLPPMPETEASVQAAQLAAHLPPPGAFRQVAQVRSVYPARPLPPGSSP